MSAEIVDLVKLWHEGWREYEIAWRAYALARAINSNIFPSNWDDDLRSPDYVAPMLCGRRQTHFVFDRWWRRHDPQRKMKIFDAIEAYEKAVK